MSFFSTKEIGNLGESLAENYLKKLGMKILERNWKYSRIGEIDIIALDKITLVFVEVKYRNNDKYGSAIESITRKKLEKIYQSALAYISQTNHKYNNYRIDVIAIDKYSKEPIKHYKNLSM